MAKKKNEETMYISKRGALLLLALALLSFIVFPVIKYIFSQPGCVEQLVIDECKLKGYNQYLNYSGTVWGGLDVWCGHGNNTGYTWITHNKTMKCPQR
jgi:hypothetical protein